MRVAWHIPGISFEEFRALPLFDRACLLDALDERIEEYNEPARKMK